MSGDDNHSTGRFPQAGTLAARILQSRAYSGVSFIASFFFAFVPRWPLLIGVALLALITAIDLKDTLFLRGTHLDGRFLPDFGAKLGEALIVAWIVSVTIERAAKSELDRKVDVALTTINSKVDEAFVRLGDQVQNDRALIKRDLIAGAMGFSLDRRYVASAIENVFEVKQIRRGYEVTYRLRRLTASSAGCGGVAPGVLDRHIEVSTEVRYSLESLSGNPAPATLSYSVPTSTGPLGHCSRVTSFSVDQKTFSPEEIASSIVTKGSEPSHIDFEFPVSGIGDAAAIIVIHATFVKERVDGDIMGFGLPCMGRGSDCS